MWNAPQTKRITEPISGIFLLHWCHYGFLWVKPQNLMLQITVFMLKWKKKMYITFK